MTPQEICQHLDPNRFQLVLNESLPKISAISRILTQNNIAFEITQSKQNFSLTVLLMGFGPACRFQDVYYLSSFFKSYGLQYVYPLNNAKGPTIQVGTYLYKFPRSSWADFTLGEPMPIDSFLEINPQLSMKDVIDLHFEDIWMKASGNEGERDKENEADEYHGFDEFNEGKLDDVVEED